MSYVGTVYHQRTVDMSVSCQRVSRRVTHLIGTNHLSASCAVLAPTTDTGRYSSRSWPAQSGVGRTV